MKYILILLGVFTITQSARADELTVFAYPPPLYLDWNTPMDLTWTTLLNNFVEDSKLIAIHSIGHMNFHLQCDPSAEMPNGTDIEIGQTDSDDSQLKNDLLKYDYGMGSSITNYSGRWENKNDIETDLPIRYHRGSVGYIHFKIQASSCVRVVEYLTEYQARGLDKIYSGLEDQARQGHGSGCSSFAASVIEIAGLMAPEWTSYWMQTRNIPMDLIGGPITGKKVSILELLFSDKAWHWNSTSDNSFPIHFWDPNLAYWWIQYANQGKVPLTGMTYTPSRRGRARGVEIDATGVPTPTDSFWQD